MNTFFDIYQTLTQNTKIKILNMVPGNISVIHIAPVKGIDSAEELTDLLYDAMNSFGASYKSSWKRYDKNFGKVIDFGTATVIDEVEESYRKIVVKMYPAIDVLKDIQNHNLVENKLDENKISLEYLKENYL